MGEKERASIRLTPEMKETLLDRCVITVDRVAFEKITDWMDRAVSEQEKAGMKRLVATKAVWDRD